MPICSSERTEGAADGAAVAGADLDAEAWGAELAGTEAWGGAPWGGALASGWPSAPGLAFAGDPFRCSTSRRMTRPWGPEPWTRLRSTPASLARRRAKGL